MHSPLICTYPVEREDGKTRRCGTDLRDTIEDEVPVDGVSHGFDCPECGGAHHATRTPED